MSLGFLVNSVPEDCDYYDYKQLKTSIETFVRLALKKRGVGDPAAERPQFIYALEDLPIANELRIQWMRRSIREIDLLIGEVSAQAPDVMAICEGAMNLGIPRLLLRRDTGLEYHGPNPEIGPVIYTDRFGPDLIWNDPVLNYLGRFLLNLENGNRQTYRL